MKWEPLPEPPLNIEGILNEPILAPFFGSSSFGVDLMYKTIKSTPNDEEPLIVHRDDILTFESLKNIVQHGIAEFSDSEIPGINVAIGPIDDVVATHIKRALRTTKGKISGPGGAAELLRINPNTLIARMKKLKICNQRNDQNQ